VTTPSLHLDPSRPYQLEGGLLAMWLPRERVRGGRARGLVGQVFVCKDPDCPCTDVRIAGVAVDDRALHVSAGPGGLTFTLAQDAEDVTRKVASWKLDTLTGEARSAGGGELDPEVARFFREPMPTWVLDDLHELWAKGRVGAESRRSVDVPDWEPGDLVSYLETHPNARFDRYVRGDRTFQVDLLFCANPECSCREGRFVVLEVGRVTDPKVINLREVCSARLLDDDMGPSNYVGEDHEALRHVYLDWRRRCVDSNAVWREQREKVRAAARELYRAGRARALPAPSAPASGIRPGRNDACVCGSGKKFKKCCGA
jgi:hypothetical protein